MENSVFIARCGSYDAELIARQVERIFEWAGGVESLLAGGKKMLVKPNLLMAREPDAATTAHPEVVCAVAAALVRAGADVTIADSPGGAYNAKALQKVYAACGIESAAERAGAKLNTDFSSRHVKYNGRTFDIITPALDVDVIINVAKLKTHMFAYYTGAVKNMFGTIAGPSKAAMHARHPQPGRFCAMLVDLCRSRTPVFSIIDGIMGMEGDGPSAGQPRALGALIASRSPYAADLAAMSIAGLRSQKSPVHRIAARLSLVPQSVSELELCGDEPVKAEPAFAEPGSGKKRLNLPSLISRLTIGRAPYPVFGEKCVGCGDCAAVCPGDAIKIINRRAVLDRKKCIRCYCCHELCPVKAIHTGK